MTILMVAVTTFFVSCANPSTIIPETPVTPEEDETDPDKPVVTEENASVSIELANVTDQNISDIESEEITVVQPTVDTDKGTIFSITKENIIID